MPLIGVNLAYTDRAWTESVWKQLAIIKPEVAVVTSFIDVDELARFVSTYPTCEIVVRPRTGPQNQPWPSDILDYRSWPSERSLRECLVWLAAAGARHRLVLGNEPRLEWAAPWPGDAENRRAARDYSRWYLAERSKIIAEYPHVKIAPAPHDQGDDNATALWLDVMDSFGCYTAKNADFLADHCYYASKAVDDPSWGGRWRVLRRRYPHLGPIWNLETNDCGDYGDGADPIRWSALRAYAMSTRAANPADLACVALFTLAGAPDDEAKPGWWFLSDRMLQAAADARSQPVTVEPPLIEEEEPTPMPVDYREVARTDAVTAGVPPEMFVRQIQQESGFRTHDANGNVLTSPGGAEGIAQIIRRWHPTVDPADPIAALAYAVDLMAGHYRRFGSWRNALAAFNWGPSNVGGYTKPDGTVVPPWDGRRETISAQGRHYLDVILGAGWPEPNEATGPQPSSVVYEELRTPHVGGRFAGTPKGVILHGSRSGVTGRPKDVEYRGTASWALNNPDGLSWHATIGETRVAVHLTPQEWGWNARAASRTYLAVEFAQATVDEEVSPAQVVALVDWIKTRVLPAWPNLPMHFPTHSEVEASGETGRRDGKTDVYPNGSPRTNALRDGIMARLQQGGTDDVTVQEAAALRAENARLQEQVNGLVTAVAVIADDKGDAIMAQVEQIRAIREQFVGARPR